MPRLSRKKRGGSKIIEKKNTKKRTKKITTKKNLKGGRGLRDMIKAKFKAKFKGSQTQPTHTYYEEFPNQKELVSKPTNNINSRIISSNTKVQMLKQLMEEYSKKIIRLIAGVECLDQHDINNNVRTTGFYCEDNNYDIEKKIKNLLDPIIENLEKKKKLANLEKNSNTNELDGFERLGNNNN